MKSVECPAINGRVPKRMVVVARLMSWARPKFAKGPKRSSLINRLRRVTYPRQKRIWQWRPLRPSTVHPFAKTHWR